ncbi:MAG TPA: hypothetical protein DCX06_10880 [Opitutae bacterium]|nr:hypothetical protein [Opitutae bacterium]
MKHSILKLSFFLAFSFICGFFTRGWFITDDSVSPKLNSSEFSTLKSAQTRDESESLIMEETADDLTHKPYHGVAVVIDTVDSPSPMTQIEAALVGRRDPDTAYALLLKYKHVLSTEDYESKLADILSAWARDDPALANRHIGELTSPMRIESVYRSIASGLATQDIKDAFAWLQSPTAEQFSDSLLLDCYSIIMYQYSELNPVGAAEVLAQLDSVTIQMELIYPILDNYAKQDFDAALNWVLDLDTFGIKSVGISELLLNQHRLDEVQTLNTIIEKQENLDGQTLASAFSILSSTDPPGMADNLYLIAEDKQSEVAQAFISEWLKSDQIAAMAWVMDHDNNGSVIDGATEAIVNAASYSETDVAFTWAEKLSDREKRVSLISKVISSANADGVYYLNDTLRKYDFSEKDRSALFEKLNARIEENTSPLIIPD